MFALGYFFNIPGFLVAWRQEVVRKGGYKLKGQPFTVEESAVHAKPTEFFDVDDVVDLQRASQEIINGKLHFTGLSLQGARWDAAGMKLAESTPRILYSPVPIIEAEVKLIHQIASSAGLGHTFPCPVYHVKGTRDKKLFAIQFTSSVHEDHWVRRGCAATCLSY